MEGVGARLGRSSTRYGPTTVFNGPVRKWKKKWVHISPPNNTSSNHHSQTTNNGISNGNNSSHLLIYKWTPISQSNNSSNGGDTKRSAQDDGAATTPAEEPPRRKFKYIPIAVLEEQINEAAEQVEDEAKPSETDVDAVEPTSKSIDFDENPDINDVPMEESQPTDDNPLARQDLNESTLDLSLDSKANDGDNDSDSRTDQTKDGQLERVNSTSVGR